MTGHATATFDLPGDGSSRLRCSACAKRACEALGEVPGVARIDCDAAAGTVRVEYDPSRLSEADLSAEMDRFGLELSKSVHHAAWSVAGLD